MLLLPGPSQADAANRSRYDIYRPEEPAGTAVGEFRGRYASGRDGRLREGPYGIALYPCCEVYCGRLRVSSVLVTSGTVEDYISFAFCYPLSWAMVSFSVGSS